MRRFVPFLFVLLLAALRPAAAETCAPPPPLVTAPPAELLALLEDDPAPLLAAADAFALAYEACYDGPMGLLELAPLQAAAAAAADNLAALRRLAEERVRRDERAFGDLLASGLWSDIEALRVAGAYAAAWGRLSLAVRRIAAEERKQELAAARRALQSLTFEFKHPVLVQRAMYGLATVQLEQGDIDTAIDTLQRLRASLRRGGSAEFKAAVERFHARITAPGFAPPPDLLQTADAPPAAAAPAGDAASALQAARQALRDTRPAAEIAALLQPAFAGTDKDISAALALLARDRSLLAAMPGPPGRQLHLMQQAFETRQFGQVEAAWPALKPFHRLLPPVLQRRVDYHMGVALLNLAQPQRAVAHLTAARKTYADAAAAATLDTLIALARLSVDEAPDTALLALAAQYRDAPLPQPAADGATNPAPTLQAFVGLRARIVLARHEAAQRNWAAADKMLTGVTRATPGYRLVLGMRVRLQAQAAKARAAAGLTDKHQAAARGAFALYRLWLSADCPPGCPSGDAVAVHGAAVELALAAALNSRQFGLAWGQFVDAGGDARALLPRAVAFLVTAADSERLMALLDPETEAAAAQVLAHWKAHLKELQAVPDMNGRYVWLSTALADLQGRPQAVLLEALTAHDLTHDRPAAALPQAEKLASLFPRRPAAWFYRAAALQANARQLEAARALSSLARRTPADDPVGMGARLGLAALFVELGRGAQACAMRAKIFSRPQAAANWQAALAAFPMLAPWQDAADNACS